MEQNVIERLNGILQQEVILTDQLSLALEDLKYLSYGNKRRKRDLLTRNVLECLVEIFKKDGCLDVHRESIFGIFASLLKVENAVFDDNILKFIFEFVFQYVTDEKLGLSAFRCLSSLVQNPLPEFVICILLSDAEDRILRSLLLHAARIESSFLMRTLTVFIQEQRIQAKLIKLGIFDAVFPKIFSNDLQELEWTLQCILHILTICDLLVEPFWNGNGVTERFNCLIGPFFPTNIQITAARCLLYTVQTNVKAKGILLKNCVLCLLRCAQGSCVEQFRAEAVGLLRIALNLRSEPVQDEDSRYLKEMLHCVLPSSTPPLQSPHTTELECNALLVISQLLMNSEESRLTVQSSYVAATALRITRSSPPKQVKSLLRALHALSRSVHHLKTTFDSRQFVDFVMDCLLNESDCEYLTLATALIANLALHFCSSRVYLTDAVAPLAALAQRNKNPSITLNAVWALTNLSCRSTAEVKLSILSHFASAEALALITHSDEQLFEKILALYRNLYCEETGLHETSELGIALSEQYQKNAANVLKMVKSALESDYSNHTKEMAISVLSNMCAVRSCQLLIANDDSIMSCIVKELQRTSGNAQFGAVLAVYNLLSGGERNRRSIEPILAHSALPHLLSHIHNANPPSNIHLRRRVDDIIRQLIG